MTLKKKIGEVFRAVKGESYSDLEEQRFTDSLLGTLGISEYEEQQRKGVCFPLNTDAYSYWTSTPCIPALFTVLQCTYDGNCDIS